MAGDLNSLSTPTHPTQIYRRLLCFPIGYRVQLIVRYTLTPIAVSHRIGDNDQISTLCSAAKPNHTAIRASTADNERNN